MPVEVFEKRRRKREGEITIKREKGGKERKAQRGRI